MASKKKSKPVNSKKSAPKPVAKKAAAKNAKAVQTKIARKVKGAVKAKPVQKAKPAQKAAAQKAKPQKAAAPKKVLAKVKPSPVRLPVAARKGSAAKGVKVGSQIPVGSVVELKPRNGKAASGLGVKDLAFFRTLLIEKRRELVGDVSSMEDEALRSSGHTNLSTLPIHMADMGTDNYEQEFTLGLVEKDRNLLRDIQRALSKIAAGTYGICEGTGKVITRARLEAQPWARYSIEHARSLEQRRMRA